MATDRAWVVAAVLVFAATSCRSVGGPEPWRCVVDGRCEGVENGANCVEDCDAVCPADPSSLGPERVYVVRELRVPRTIEDSETVGADLDGDGQIDNRWGRVWRILDNALEPGGPPDTALARGALVLVVAVRGDLSADGGRIAVQILQQGRSEAPLRFDGTDVITLAPPEPAGSYACGRVQGHGFYAGPSAAATWFPLVINDERPLVVDVPLSQVTVRGSQDGTRLELTVGGVLDPGRIIERAAPLVLDLASIALPRGSDQDPGQTLLALFDGDCSADPAYGCAPMPADCTRDGILTAAEVRCNSLIRGLVSPDLDLDGEEDGLTIGYSATLVPAHLRGWCGDGVLDPASGEVCEAGQVGRETCSSLGFSAAGAPGCTGCSLDASACEPLCGDGVCHPEERAAGCPADCLARELDAGSAHTCAVRVDGQLSCWGANSAGQVHPGWPGVPVWTPTRLEEVRDASTVALGDAHTCLQRRGGSVSCFGDNDFGQLGVAGTSAGTALAEVRLPAPTALVDAGGNHTCASLTTGDVYCWGDNSRFQLGWWIVMRSPVPVQVDGLPPIRGLALGRAHTCALSVSGGVWCWGDNAQGQLGGGPTSARATPVEVPLPAPAVDVAAGWSHTCAALTDGTALCWGAGEQGQLGNGTTEGSPSPTRVLDLAEVTRLAAGREHTCAMAGGRLYCWGRSADGELGIGTRQHRLVPAAVGVASPPLAIHLGERHSCQIGPEGTISCWGANWHGQAGQAHDVGMVTEPASVSGF